MSPPIVQASGPRPPGGSTLPAELTTFVGRRQELEDVRRLLGAGRLVTLTGVGGVGKSRLALRVGVSLRRAFTDGVWLIDLAALREPALLPDVTMQAVGLEPGGPQDPVAVLIEYFQGKQVLLIMDNCEHLATGMAEFLALLLVRIPTLRVLATSRHALRVSGEHLYPVAPFAAPPAGAELDTSHVTVYPALALFADRAAAAVPGFQVSSKNLPDVAALCRALDGVPLAIELAAVRLRVLSPADMAARLTRRLQVLDDLSDVRPARHLTLRAMIDASHELCTPGERMLWGRASVFGGGFDLSAAEEVCSDESLPRAAIVSTLAGLVEKSILIREERPNGLRFRLLEVLREYGQDHLSEGDDALELKRRHRNWCKSLIDDACERWASPAQPSLLSKLRDELANIRLAIDFSLSRPDEVVSGTHMVGRPWFLWLILITEGRRWLERVIAADDTPSSERARVLATCGLVASIQGDTDAATRYFSEGTHLARLLNNPLDADYAYHARAMSVGFVHPGQADSLIREASPLDISEAVRDGGIAIAGRLALATATLTRGDLANSVDHIERCAQLGESVGWALVQGYAYWGLGLAALLRGEPMEALTHARRSLITYHGESIEMVEAMDLDLLGWIQVSAGNAELGAVLMGAASAVWRTFGRDLFGAQEWISLREQAEGAARAALGDAAFDDTFERGNRTPLEEAVALALDQRIDPAPARHAPDSVLTPREEEVASLVAQGLSNKEISQRLVISVRTAEGHVERILSKLGFTSRAQIANWAARAASNR